VRKEITMRILGKYRERERERERAEIREKIERQKECKER
jgi:hypothetical protein